MGSSGLSAVRARAMADDRTPRIISCFAWELWIDAFFAGLRYTVRNEEENDHGRISSDNPDRFVGGHFRVRRGFLLGGAETHAKTGRDRKPSSADFGSELEAIDGANARSTVCRRFRGQSGGMRSRIIGHLPRALAVDVWVGPGMAHGSYQGCSVPRQRRQGRFDSIAISLQGDYFQLFQLFALLVITTLPFLFNWCIDQWDS